MTEVGLRGSHGRQTRPRVGLDQCTAEEFDAFQRLNTAYGDKFGHPFIIAVNSLSRSDILAAFERCIDNDAATEFATGLAEVHKIARLRLEAMAGQYNAGILNWASN